MPDPNAVVSTTIRFEPPLDRPPAELLRTEGLSVELEDGRRVRLDPEDSRSEGFAQILDGLSKQRLPVYLEIDPGKNVISRLLIPHVTRVVDLRLIDDNVLVVRLELSHGRHVLRLDQPDAKSLEAQLREAERNKTPVILTEDDAHNIIDVRFFPPGPEGPPLPLPKPRPEPISWPWIVHLLLRVWRWRWWPWWWLWWWLHCLSPAKAQQVFNAMNSAGCDPLTVPAPCIPFLYPDDGCWARAHEMCRLIINMGLSPSKTWIEGYLHVQTRNNPNCAVWWGWHVAPTLCVRGPAFLQTQDMVIDPSLFTTPVSKATWKGVQGDPSATLTDSDASIYYLWGNVTDPNYTATNSYLAFYRLQLQNRSVQHGPPPYAHCP
jgi:uncharacterized protein (UPF0216 family)